MVCRRETIVTSWVLLLVTVFLTTVLISLNPSSPLLPLFTYPHQKDYDNSRATTFNQAILNLLWDLAAKQDKKHFSENILRALKPRLENKLQPKRTEVYKNSLYNIARAKSNQEQWQMLDILNLPPYNFDPHYKNPCWWETKEPYLKCPFWPHSKPTLKQVQASNGTERVNNMTLRCLPYFYIIGQQKCGSTDLYFRLSLHPDISLPSGKETYWFYMTRYEDVRCMPIDSYVDLYQPQANTIKKRQRPGVTNPHITGDGSVGFLSHNPFWDMLPGNEGCSEPCVTNADLIHHITPSAKLILMLRNPTERVYSYYFQRNSNLKILSAENFNILVLRDIQLVQECIAAKSLRACCYDNRFSDQNVAEIDLVGGIYHVFLSDWLKVYPRDQLHFIKFDHYKTNTTDELKAVMKFLELRELSSTQWTKIIKAPKRNTRTKNGLGVGEMWNSTRQLLDAFYEPFNRELSRLLNDEYMTLGW